LVENGGQQLVFDWVRRKIPTFVVLELDTMAQYISGFSKMSKAEKIDWLTKTYFSTNPTYRQLLEAYWNTDAKLQKLHDEFIENTLSNFYLPFAVAPNFLINGKFYTVPMVIEESSVVAAAGNAAKFWAQRGGFHTRVLGSRKNGQVHLNYRGERATLVRFFEQVKPRLLESVRVFSERMNKRGGGIIDIELVDKTAVLAQHYFLHCTFETADAMGANFINTCLEQFAQTLRQEAEHHGLESLGVVMSILSNYVPECVVYAEVSCPVSDLKVGTMNGPDFAQKFVRAVAIAQTETSRAVTHNKGIMNGIDAVILATGNDFRAIEAGAHAYASRSGSYTSLTQAKIQEDRFVFSLEIPMALGTVGGLTGLHPLVQVALAILENPNAQQLMQITAAVGLAQNFAAVRSLITTGIQNGHMKMHLNNILNQLQASEEEKNLAKAHFGRHSISHQSVQEFLEKQRSHA
jgi:hydroxymethylglutaryl-CoA reductase